MDNNLLSLDMDFVGTSEHEYGWMVDLGLSNQNNMQAYLNYITTVTTTTITDQERVISVATGVKWHTPNYNVP